jgi:hypothetical protein
MRATRFRQSAKGTSTVDAEILLLPVSRTSCERQATASRYKFPVCSGVRAAGKTESAGAGGTEISLRVQWHPISAGWQAPACPPGVCDSKIPDMTPAHGGPVPCVHAFMPCRGITGSDLAASHSLIRVPGESGSAGNVCLAWPTSPCDALEPAVSGYQPAQIFGLISFSGIGSVAARRPS